MSSYQKKLLEEYGIKNIVNYLRRSRQDEEREKKTGEDTLHEQKMLMDRVLASYGVPYDQRTEIGSGDKISTRPVFQSVLKDLKAGKYDAIAVKDISRLGRGSYADMGVIYDLIVNNRIFIITPWKIYDPSNPADLRQIRFELFMSREEFETIRERLVGGRYNAAMEGKWVVGRIPFGYKYNQQTKKLEILEEEAEIVRTIFDLYAYGIPDKNGKRKLVQLGALSTYLNRIGIRTPQGSLWYASWLKRFLSNKRFIGTLKFGNVIVENAIPPIIDKETWDVVQQRISEINNPHVKLDFTPCELAGLCVCKKCGKAMIKRKRKRTRKLDDGSVETYYLEYLECAFLPSCSRVRYRDIEEDLLRILNKLRKLDIDILKQQLNNIIKNTRKRDNSEELKKQIDARKDELKRRLKFIYEKFESGIYSDEEFISRRAEIEKELSSLENMHIEDHKSEDIDIDTVRQNISSILDAYMQATEKEDKNRLLRAVFERVYVNVIEKGRGKKPSKYELIPVLKRDILMSDFIDHDE